MWSMLNGPYGGVIRGQTSTRDYASALVNRGFNTFNPGYVQLLVDTGDTVNKLLHCVSLF